MWSRRSFLALPLRTLPLGLLGTRVANAQALDLATLDRARILRAADRYLGEAPLSITASRSPRSTGGAHDYFSEGDYW